MRAELDTDIIKAAITLVGGNAESIAKQHKLDELLKMLEPNGLTLVPKFTKKIKYFTDGNVML